MKSNVIEIINAYDEFTVDRMIAEAQEDAIKHERFKQKMEIRRKAKERKQKIAFKLLSLACIIGGIAIPFISPIDGSAAVACIGIGLVGLLVPFNMEITW